MSYEDRLKSLELTTLEDRQKIGDLIYMYKLTKGSESIKKGKKSKIRVGNPQNNPSKRNF